MYKLSELTSHKSSFEGPGDVRRIVVTCRLNRLRAVSKFAVECQVFTFCRTGRLWNSSQSHFFFIGNNGIYIPWDLVNALSMTPERKLMCFGFHNVPRGNAYPLLRLIANKDT